MMTHGRNGLGPVKPVIYNRSMAVVLLGFYVAYLMPALVLYSPYICVD